jgi:LuxR family maltose regulon positive regulatory protein
MKINRTIAKIKRPTLLKVFSRKRLFNLLDGKRDKQVIWVTGPPGSGKTILVASYLEAFKLPNIWYQLDAGDADIASFFYYMSIAAKTAAPHQRKSLPLLTPEYLHGIPAFSRRYFENFYSRFHSPFLLVLDDYQEVPADSPFHETLCEGIPEASDGVNIIIISRSGPPEAFTGLRAKAHMNIIGWNDLKFNLNESKRFLRLSGNGKLSDDILEKVHNRFDGWPAGLVLLLESMKTKNIEPVFLNSYLPEEVFSFFAQEIFSKTDMKEREFLLKTAYFPLITVPMAEALTGNPGAGAILSELNRKNYFTNRYTSQTEVFQYHPMFREFLFAQAEKNVGSDELSGIQREAAAILESSGYIKEAVELFGKSGAWPELQRLVITNAREMMSQGRGRTLEAWIRMLPDDLIYRNPWLLYWLGACRMPFNPDESYMFFEKAFNLFTSLKDPGGLFLSISGVLDSVHFSMKTFKPFDVWLERLYELLSEYNGFPSIEIESRVVSSLLGAFYLRQPQHPDFERWEDRALVLSQDCRDMYTKTQIFNKLLCHHTFSGNLAKASLLLNFFRNIVKSADISTLASIILKNDEAFYFWISAQFEDSFQAVTEGLELAFQTGVHCMDYLLLGHGTALSLSSGKLERAAEFLDRMQTCLNGMRTWEKAVYHFLKTWESILLGDMNTASVHAEFSLKYSSDVGMPHTEAMCLLAKSYIMHETGHKKASEDLLEKARRIGEHTKNKITEFMCLLGETYKALDHADEKLALEYLKKAMTLGREQGYFNTYLWMPPVMTGLCIKALEAGIEVEYVRILITKRNLVPESPPVECEKWPWRLKIFTLGRFDIMKDERQLFFEGKVRHKPLTMLKAMIALGGREVTEEKLTDILWPEADGDAAHSAFTTTLSRLRQLLGFEQSIRFAEGKAVLDPRYCWVDVWAFERMLGKTDRLWKHDMTVVELSYAVRLIEKGINIYKGPFLSDSNEPWTLSIRERLRSKFLRNIKRMGFYWEQAGEFEKAVECYQKGLETDDLTEEFYRNIMNCHLQTGKRAEAIIVYKRCREILSTVLGIQPSPETEAVYKALV